MEELKAIIYGALFYIALQIPGSAIAITGHMLILADGLTRMGRAAAGIFTIRVYITQDEATRKFFAYTLERVDTSIKYLTIGMGILLVAAIYGCLNERFNKGK